MYAQLCKGLTLCSKAHMYNEILRPYAGIIRIRFMGMISASVSRAPLQFNIFFYFFSTSWISYSFGQFFPVR